MYHPSKVEGSTSLTNAAVPHRTARCLCRFSIPLRAARCLCPPQSFQVPVPLLGLPGACTPLGLPSVCTPHRAAGCLYPP